MRYREWPAPPDLAAGVECFWWLRDESGVHAPHPEPVYPDGCVELIVHLGDPFREGSSRTPRLQPRGFMVGPIERPLLLHAPARVDTVGVRFRPGGAARHLRLPLGRIAGRRESLRDLFDGDADRLVDQLAEAPRIEARLGLLARFLRRRQEPDRRPAWLEPALATVLAARGDLRVETLARVAGTSRRSLERRFHDQVGHSPKRLARIVRFQGALRRIGAADPLDGVELALDCGYFDQPHMLREFRALAGMSPRAHRGGAGRLARLFTSSARLEAYFRTGMVAPLSHSSKPAAPTDG